jgi:polyisoprenoid-binding protein YceI
MLKRLSSLALPLALALAAGPAAASSWVLDADHTTVGFSVRHMMVTEQKGAFDTFTGAIELDDKDLTKSTVNVTIDAASINTKSKKRDDHLRSPDFFDVAQFPKLTFTSTKVEKAKDGGYTVTGNLSLHGVTKPVTLTMAPLSDGLKDPWGNIHRGTTAVAKINREDFGLKWNAAIEKGGVVVGKDVTIELQIELLPAPAAAPAAPAAPATKK